MAINPETEFSGKIAASDDDYPYGSAQNVTTAGDGTGTPWKARLINDIWGFFQKLLNDAGVTPSGDPDTVQASDYMDAAKVIFLSGNYLHIRDEKTSGTVGDSSSGGGTWDTLELNTSVKNTIDEASLSSNQITLPAGTYRIKARSPFHQTSTFSGVFGHRIGLYDTTSEEYVAYGSSAWSTFSSGDWDNATSESIIEEDITITVESVLELHHYTNKTGVFGKSVSITDVNEYYSDIKIRKLD